MTEGRPTPDPRVADLVRSGRVRVAIFLPQFTRDPGTGTIHRDVHLTETARALAGRLGVELQFVEHPSPTRALESIAAGACDVGFMGNEPSRAGRVAFSPPLFELDFNWLVPADSSISRIADTDRDGVRIAVVRDHVSTLALGRILKRAEMVEADTPDLAFEVLRARRADAFASVGFVLHGYRERLPGSRVLDERYGANLLAMAVHKDRPGWLAYVREFVEEAKASGVIRRAIDLGGLRGLRVAPPGP